MSLPCDEQSRHAFHEACLKSWFKRKEECPLCKQPIEPHRFIKREELPPVNPPNEDERIQA